MLLAVQDNDPGCQRHLAQPLPWHAEHVLDDMTALIDHRLDPLELHPDNCDYGVISQKIWSSGLTLQIWCASCGDFHAQSDLVADWEWDSTPRTMRSSSGREKHLADPANFVWICTTRRHHLTATPAIMHGRECYETAGTVRSQRPSVAADVQTGACTQACRLQIHESLEGLDFHATHGQGSSSS